MNSRASAEGRVLVSPAQTFRGLTETVCRGVWVGVRRPLLLLVMAGCTVSLLGASRLSIRLMVDGAVSFAFVPVIQAIALGIVYRMSPRSVPFARALDVFFVGNSPWFIWMIAVGVMGLVQSPQDAAIWTPNEVWGAIFGGVLVAGWSYWIDLHFFRAISPSLEYRPQRDVLLFRVIAWPLAVGYFLGMAIWPEIAGRIWL